MSLPADHHAAGPPPPAGQDPEGFLLSMSGPIERIDDAWIVACPVCTGPRDFDDPADYPQLRRQLQLTHGAALHPLHAPLRGVGADPRVSDEHHSEPRTGRAPVER